MIRKVVSFAVTLALLHAAARVAIVASRYYRLRTSAWEIVVTGGEVPTERLRDEIFERAVALAVPLERYDIDVRRIRELTRAEGYYSEPVVLFPGVIYPVDLSFSIQASATQARAVKELKDFTR